MAFATENSQNSAPGADAAKMSAARKGTDAASVTKRYVAKADGNSLHQHATSDEADNRIVTGSRPN